MKIVLEQAMGSFEKWFTGTRELLLATSVDPDATADERAMVDIVLGNLADAATAWRVYQNLSSDDPDVKEMAEQMAAVYQAEQSKG